MSSPSSPLGMEMALPLGSTCFRQVSLVGNSSPAGATACLTLGSQEAPWNPCLYFISPIAARGQRQSFLTFPSPWRFLTFGPSWKSFQYFMAPQQAHYFCFKCRKISEKIVRSYLHMKTNSLSFFSESSIQKPTRDPEDSECLTRN